MGTSFEWREREHHSPSANPSFWCPRQDLKVWHFPKEIQRIRPATPLDVRLVPFGLSISPVTNFEIDFGVASGNVQKTVLSNDSDKSPRNPRPGTSGTFFQFAQ
jgi:hypothetical protein